MIPIKPIGLARTSYLTKAEVPRQANLSAPGTIELFPESGFEHALEDLETWSHLWVLFQFHQVENWRPKVLPPRSEQRRGVFATRSPHRPNAIGLSAVELRAVEGLQLHVGGLDLVDGTPILDLKPYVPYTDCIPEANSGWLPVAGQATPKRSSDPRGPAQPQPDWRVTFSSRAVEQLECLKQSGETLEAKLLTLLETGPTPRPYRRIRTDGVTSTIAFGPWRARFVHDAAARSIEVLSLATGYRQTELAGDQPELTPHRALVAGFGYPGY
ncbi:MAG: tRNA (N6-threonylcarbamoyladenosine(37)-N6)-methyltransferase TrmO [Polyangiaceae bacterium]|nr:tRNA (N6-threonylcarbamoyladenosine(37)-N6)-methyltransferase TrmO [Myxococcales bacterium]MCB9586247.1 tRNA (N6-threonylcarbamoyladenosine(37)-N6)-methyltransferase TrmO [Polyangiaceae bacterium]MCB9606924.1 tRNA (N6-threonylcarbamoyladenosine(37)-N6)-methyltransferase TrmO [Polyangiaceae bacterium]